MNRIDAAFARLRAGRQKAFIPYLTAGVPGPDETVELALALAGLGADIIELGYPFSDPMADGVVNQAAANLALQSGLGPEGYFGIAEKFRARSQVPLIAFSYLNPLFKFGFDAFVRRAKSAGMDGILLVDMPVEESGELQTLCRREGLALIFLVAPTTTPERLKKVVEAATGFIYYISRTGTTGERDGFQADFESKVAGLKASCGLPVVVGFGISNPGQVRTVCRLSDGVVVGSALVRHTLEKMPFPAMLEKVTSFAAPLAAPTKEKWN